VEWSVTAAAVAVFLLIYALFSKLFPMISMWETRKVEAAPVKAEPAESPSRGWSPISSIPVILISLILVGASLAHAGETRNPQKPTPTTISLEWQSVPVDKESSTHEAEAPPGSVPGGRIHLSLLQLFGHLSYGSKSGEDEKPATRTAVKAILRDAKGSPVAFQPVSFSLQTSFGSVQYGNRPTNEQGKAELIVSDQRFGEYPVVVAYGGSDAFANTRAQILVDFGSRPIPALPRAGILIAPYATPAIGLPFVLFYGTMWVIFFYAFGYLILWRLRHPGKEKQRT
jgi:hypothetical protein